MECESLNRVYLFFTPLVAGYRGGNRAVTQGRGQGNIRSNNSCLARLLAVITAEGLGHKFISALPSSQRDVLQTLSQRWTEELVHLRDKVMSAAMNSYGGGKYCQQKRKYLKAVKRHGRADTVDLSNLGFALSSIPRTTLLNSSVQPSVHTTMETTDVGSKTVPVQITEGMLWMYLAYDAS
jgi:hypothetical protein